VSLKAVNNSGQSLGGKMMLPVDVAIAQLPLSCLHQFGIIDFKGTSSFWARSGGLLVPDQDYREDVEESHRAECSGGSLWCELYVVGHC
jgi:hypothetical protein